jgi:ABC-type spermidine/putrescine transport system permease subunit I
MQNVSNGVGEIAFVDALGGTGKTFLRKLIQAAIRSHNDIAVALASSGIAAKLLSGG